MIVKPEMTKKLAWIAFYLEIGWIVLNVIFIFLTCVLPFSGTYSSLKDVKIPLSLPIIKAVGQCCMIPFAWSCLRSALQKEISENHAMSNLILPAVLYYIGLIGNWIMQFISTRAATVLYSTEVLGIFSMKMQYQQFLTLLPVQIAALVLICCASAIEIYILKHKES